MNGHRFGGAESRFERPAFAVWNKVQNWRAEVKQVVMRIFLRGEE